MRRIRIGFSVALLVLLSSCEESKENDDFDSLGHSETVIHSSHADIIDLNGEGAVNEEYGVELIEASENSASIRATETRRVLKAAVGDYFSSEEFGRIGLQLIESDPGTKSVKLIRRWSETRTVSPTELGTQQGDDAN